MPWLASHLDDPNLRILDATVYVKLFPIPRIMSGRREWKRGHIPGTAFADLKKLSDPNKRSYTFTLPTAASNALALHLLGHPKVVVYEGGLVEWNADRSLPLELGD